MKRTDAWSDPRHVQRLRRRIDAIAARLPRPVTFMEVCGTHTHAIAAAIREERWEPARELLADLLRTWPEDQALRILDRRCWHQLLLLSGVQVEA